MKLNKRLLSIAAIILQSGIILADITVKFEEHDKQAITAPETQEQPVKFENYTFTGSEYDTKYHRKNDTFNPKSENKALFRSGELRKLTGNFLSGLGFGGILFGAGCSIYGRFAKKDKYYQENQSDSDEDELEIRNVYMYTGGIIAASGIGLLVCGVFLLEYTGPVIRRDHTSINLKADVLNRELGAEISLSF